MLKYLLIFIPLFSQSQITLFGELKNSNLRQVDITVIKSSGSQENINTFDREYKLNLDYGFVYDIQFKKSGYLTKTVRIDTRNIPFEDRRGGFEIELNGKLLKKKEGMDPDIEKTISNFASYDHKYRAFDWKGDYLDVSIGKDTDSRDYIIIQYEDMGWCLVFDKR